MEENSQILNRLLKEGNWSDEERRWFLEYLDNNDTSALLKLMQQQFTEDITGDAITMDDSARKILALIHEKINKNTQPAKVIRLSMWKKIAAAAVIVFLLGTGAYVLFSGKSRRVIAKTENKNVPVDIKPGGNNAVLTLANGSTIILNDVQNGTITQQGNTKILKLGNGQLAYNPLEEKPAEVLYNTVTIPRGGHYQLILADGSKVWLNAASSIRFPTAFTGADREVRITGEAYFEVAHNANMPFHVKVKNMDVMVLGTHFNVNAYEDEGVIKTTLLEGSVKVSKGKKSEIIRPGEQAQIADTADNIEIKKNVDLAEVVAWKNDRFVFSDADIKTVMRQLARWYNFNIEFTGDIKDKFHVEITRNTNVSNVFKILEGTGGVHFKIEENKVIVKP